MKYDNYLQTVAERFESHLSAIAAVHNFDYGPEFEIALCKTLRLALPAKYGVCRGYLVDIDGNKEGDDIIIYDHDRFPSLRMLGDEGFANRERIPIEAAYAYIEAKHRLTFDGDEPTYPKALDQVAKAKALVSNRPTVSDEDVFDPYVTMTGLQTEERAGRPSIWNPFFTAIISRHVGRDAQKNLLHQAYSETLPPDLIIAGENIVGLPVVEDKTQNVHKLVWPFMVAASRLRIQPCPGLAFAFGFCALMYALDTIRLGRMPWTDLMMEVIGPKQE